MLSSNFFYTRTIKQPFNFILQLQVSVLYRQELFEGNIKTMLQIIYCLRLLTGQRLYLFLIHWLFHRIPNSSNPKIHLYYGQEISKPRNVPTSQVVCLFGSKLLPHRIYVQTLVGLKRDTPLSNMSHMRYFRSFQKCLPKSGFMTSDMQPFLCYFRMTDVFKSTNLHIFICTSIAKRERTNPTQTNPIIKSQKRKSTLTHVQLFGFCRGFKNI